MNFETALKHFRNWQARRAVVLVVLQAGGVKLSSAAGVMDVGPSGVSFALPGERKNTLQVSFKGAVFEESCTPFPNMALLGLTLTLPGGGTCIVQEVWRVGAEDAPADLTDKVQ